VAGKLERRRSWPLQDVGSCATLFIDPTSLDALAGCSHKLFHQYKKLKTGRVGRNGRPAPLLHFPISVPVLMRKL